MDVDALRMMVLVAMLIVPAVTDIRTRTVYSDAIMMCEMVAVCFFVYDLMVEVQRGLLWYGLAIIGCVIGTALSKFGMIGSADGHAIIISSVMMPEYEGVPVAILGTMSGFIGGLASMMLYNASCNISDAIRKKPYCGDVSSVTMHMKRKGERFTTIMTGPVRLSVHNDIIRTRNGTEYFALENAEGMPVGITMPAVAFIAAGTCIVSLLAAF